MPLPPRITPTKQQTRDRSVNDAQTQAARTGQALNNFPLQPGVIVTGVAGSVGPVLTVNHKLGRVPTGWFIVRSYGFVTGTVAMIEVGPSTDKVLLLGAQGTFTADIWVF